MVVAVAALLLSASISNVMKPDLLRVLHVLTVRANNI